LAFLQDAVEANYMATKKTIRQVKTVFVIFIAFVCCWSPYIVVLLYDSSDSLPLPVHLYASMLAHLHASLNCAIYRGSSRALCARYRCRQTTPTNVVAIAAAANSISGARRTCAGRIAGCSVEDDDRRTLVSVECYELRQINGSRRAVSFCSTEDHERVSRSFS